ncbi:MAG: transglycosylase domain-containing protein, partial [Micromonosporaceae bacterium]
MKRTRDRGFLANAAMLLVWGLAAGVAVAAAAFPAVAAAGLGAKYSADQFEELPSELKLRPLAQRTEVYANDGKTLITAFYDENRQYVSLDKIDPVMVDAIVAAEDQRFYEHHGVDVKGILRAMVANHQAGEVEQGASTLTMQYVRQALVYSARTPAEVRAATDDTAV